MVTRIMPAKEQTAQEIKTLVENIEATSGTVVDINGGKYKPNMRKHLRTYEKLVHLPNLSPAIIANTEDYLVYRGSSTQWTAINKNTKEHTVIQFNSLGSTFTNGSILSYNYNQVHLKHTSGNAVQSGDYIYVPFHYNNIGHIVSLNTTLFTSSRDGGSLNYSTALDPDAITTIGSSATNDFNNNIAKMAKTRKYVFMYNHLVRKILYFENNGTRMTNTNRPLEFTMYGVDIGNGTLIGSIAYITDAEDENEDVVLMIGSTQSGTQFICKYNIVTSEILSYVINGDFLYTTLTSKGCTYDKNGMLIIRTSHNGSKVVKVDKQTLVTNGVIPCLGYGSGGLYAHVFEVRDNGDVIFIDPLIINQPAMATSLPIGLELRSLSMELINFETGKSELLPKILFDVSEFSGGTTTYVATLFEEYSDKIYLNSIHLEHGINIGKIVDVIDSYEVVE